jgi:hypothetical protein
LSLLPAARHRHLQISCAGRSDLDRNGGLRRCHSMLPPAGTLVWCAEVRAAYAEIQRVSVRARQGKKAAFPPTFLPWVRAAVRRVDMHGLPPALDFPPVACSQLQRRPPYTRARALPAGRAWLACTASSGWTRGRRFPALPVNSDRAEKRRKQRPGSRLRRFHRK